ncbi:YchJ family protein [Microbacterium radiodurans]|uniref:UPF0225 protein F6B42_09320 n=1 Tax=Microbacterium radiodurans TaxID=661398 RepID=A0A5J5IRQ5_9MICO|nr:YchJ family metal-binding protein [Microbacterium radiodurans]KAA9087145.1 hypothetical protein F6B42_09320 [Microbacterium radiodurans]
MSFGRAASTAGRRPAPTATCPCGSADSFAGCCGPLLAGAPAETAADLMRSRYTAFVVGDAAHLARTWHPRTRPRDTAPEPGTAWIGLTVVRTEAGGPGEDRGVVEFRARWRDADGVHDLHETSRFERVRGRWTYVDGDLG